MSKAGRIVLLLVLLLTALGGYWVATHFERRTITISAGLSGEAAANPLLAAERFLQAMGIPARRVEDPATLPAGLGPGDLLLVSHDRRTLGPRRSEALLAWVRDGGRLVVTVEAPEYDEEQERWLPVRDPLLERLGLAVRGIDPDTEEHADWFDIDWPAADDFLRVRLPADRVLEGARAGDTVLEGEWGVLLVRRKLGAGTVTVITDLGFIHNPAIGELDHARFLWHLVDGRGPVWLLQDIAMPPIDEWLWRQAPHTLAALATLLILWLWRRAPRLGPPLPLPPPARRRILEHVEAGGRFLWRHGQRATLLAALRDEILARAARRHPGWAGLGRDERAAWLAEHHGLDPELAQRLLRGPDALAADGRLAFTHLVQRLQTLRKSL